MKRILAALAISTALLIVWAVLSSIVVIAVSRDLNHFNMRAVYLADIPIRLPKYALYYFFPPTPEDYAQQFSARKAVLAISIFASNIILYTIPAYLVLSITVRLRKKPGNQINEYPPPPPGQLHTN